MVTETTFRFPSDDGTHQIFVRQWTPDAPAPRGIIQIVHGISEHIDRYSATARFLAEQGFLVVGNDHLGHGRTALGPEEYGFFAKRNGWTIVSNDVHHLRTIMGKKYPSLPYCILGHSMGSFLTRTYLIRWPGTIDAVILSGTGQELASSVSLGWHLANLFCRLFGPRHHSKLISAFSFGAYNRQFAPNRTNVDWISRDEAVVDAYRKDPLCRFLPTVGMFRDMMEGLKLISQPSNLRQMDPSIPVLFFSGDRDPVGQNGAGVKKVAEWFRQAGVKSVTVKLYPGGRHEMLNEINRDEVLQDLLSWLNRHMPAAAEPAQ